MTKHTPPATAADLALHAKLAKTSDVVVACDKPEQKAQPTTDAQPPKSRPQPPPKSQQQSQSQQKLQQKPQPKKTSRSEGDAVSTPAKDSSQNDAAQSAISSKSNQKSKTKRAGKYKKQAIPAHTLGLDPKSLPQSIVEVLKKLQNSGFEAYIVGGGVRDALVGLEPKDFDAVTDATPAQIKEVFGKRCRIIGRRFKLAHVYSGRDMIEVATFRAPPAKKNSTNADGMIVRDNAWGTMSQDFARRDFSINALYYDPLKTAKSAKKLENTRDDKQPKEGAVYDFCHALDDIKQKRIAFLGDTQVRIDEDPVRLLRALRFAAKLGFALDDEVHAAYTADNWAHLKTVSPHRLYDETLKLFGGGYVTKALPLLTRYGAMDYLFAHRETVITPLVEKVAENTDARISIGKSINPAFFYAALLWPAYQNQLKKYAEQLPLVEAMNKAAIQVVNSQRQITAIPKFAENFIRETWSLQPRLINPKPKQIPAIADQGRFRAAFDFLLLRENTGEAATKGMGAWWQNYQELDAEEKQTAINALSQTLAHEQRASVPMDDTALAASSKAALSLPDGQKLPARRRPRRRKKPASRGSDSSSSDS